MNILLIVADDFVHYGLGMLNGGVPLTPALDELASKATTFTQATSTGMMCKPGRSSLLTSLYPHEHGQFSNQIYLDPGTGAPNRFLPQQLVNAGFTTTGFGKWHSRFTPAEAGFQQWQGGMEASWQDILAHVDTLGGATQPWFLYLAFSEPHRPWWPKPSVLAAYDGLSLPQRPNVNVARVGKPVMQDTLDSEGDQMLDDDGFDPADPDMILKYYYAMISILDWRVGKVLKKIKNQGLAGDTIVVFTSDQGQMLQNHSISFKGPLIYEEMMRIPMIFRWPGVADSGATNEEIFEVVDLAPTLLDAVGGTTPQQFSGVSVAPALQGQSHTWKDFSVSQTFLEPPVSGHLRCLRSRKVAGQPQWKLGLYDNDIHEFYDLTADPFEIGNVATAQPAEFQATRNSLETWMTANGDVLPGPGPNPVP